MSTGGKKAQRTKGNVKPSSSAKAAEMLNASGFGVSSTAGFIGFGAADEEFEQLDPDFRVAFRKLVKKETTTKIKALKEIQELIDKSDEKIIFTAWQCWPRLYSRVSMDGDFKVREESHNVLDCFFRKLGRQIASQLKSVMPFLLLGEHDPYPLAASAARLSFQSAFPSAKRSQALKFCKESIISEFSDIIYGERIYKNESTSSKVDSETENDAEMKTNRLCACSLSAMSTLLNELNADDCLSVDELIKERFLNQSKFWNVGKSKISSIKTAFIKFISVIICKLPETAKQFADRISPLIVNNMDRQSIEVCRSAWDGVLLCLEQFPDDFWKNVNFQKAFFPKISSILRKSGDGLATAVCPALLPVVSKLSTSGVADLNQYFLKLSSNFEQGIRISSEPKFDSVERISFLQSYIDCLKFLITNLLREKDILNQILVEQCFSIFTLCMSSEIISKQKEIYTIFADLLSFVIDLRRKRDEFDEEIQQKFVSIVMNWCKNSIRINSNVEQIRFLLYSTSKRNECKNFTAEICRHSWSFYVADGSLHCLRLLCDVLRNGNDMSSLLDSMESITSKERELVVFDVENCTKIVSEKDLTSSAEFDECTLLISCLFSFWSGIDDERRRNLLKKAFELKSSSMRYATLARLATIWNDIPLEIVRSAEFRDLFLICFAEMTDKIANGDRSLYDFHVFVEILCLKRDEKIVLSSLVDAILDDLLRLIKKKSIDRTVLYRCVDLVARISYTLFSSSDDIATSILARDLVLALFDMYAADVLPNELSETLLKTWMFALKPNVLQTGGLLDENCLVTKMARRLTDRIMEQNFNEISFKRSVDVAKCLLFEFNRLLTNVDDAESMEILNDSSMNLLVYLLPTKIQWARLIEDVTTNDSSWKFNAQFSNSMPIFVFVEEKFDEKMIKTSLERLIRVCTYSLRLYDGLSTSSTETKFVDIFANSFCSSMSLLVYLTNFKEFLNCTSIVERSTFDDVYKAAAVGVFEELSRLENVFKTNCQSIFSSFYEFVKNFNRLWTLTLTNFIDEYEIPFEKMETLIDSPASKEISCRISARKLFDFDEISTNIDEKRIDKLAETFIFASENQVFEQKLDLLNRFVDGQSIFDDVLLFNRDLSSVSIDIVHFNVALVRFFNSLIDNLHGLKGDAQDFIFCSLLAWLQSCYETKTFDVARTTFAVVVVQLFNEIAEFVSKSNDELTKNIVDDWKEFFSNGCEAVLVPFFVNLCGRNLHKLSGYVCCEISSALEFVDGEKLLDYDLPLLLSPELDALKYPQKLQTILLHFFPLLTAERHRSIQIGAYNVLKKIVGKLCEYESQGGNESDEQTRAIPSYFLNILKSSYENLHEIDDDDDESSSLDANETLYSNVLAFFLTWKLLINFFNNLKSDDRPVYSMYLRNSGLLDEFLATVFSFVSSENEPQFRSNEDNSMNSEKNFNRFIENFVDKSNDFIVSMDKTDYFTRAPRLDPKTMGTTAELRHLACNVYFDALRSFPAAVRQWFNNLDRKTKFTVERFTSKFISPILCSYELENISKNQRETDKMTLQTRLKANQIVANYALEDLKMELILTLPSNYPLAQVSVEAPERVAVSNDKWRSWMFQLITCQNGSLLDGLFLWKRCVDKHLEGVEDCTICMMSVHGSSYKLPKVTCRQCKKKFHSECLRKWFETSNNANCPLCRTEFSN